MVGYAWVEGFALTLPETTSSPSYNDSPALRVNKKMLGRLRVEMAEEYDEVVGSSYGEILMLKVADLGEKEALLSGEPRIFFTVSHYDGYAAVLVRLALIDENEMRESIIGSWMSLAPKRALKAYVDRFGPLPGLR